MSMSLGFGKWLALCNIYICVTDEKNLVLYLYPTTPLNLLLDSGYTKEKFLERLV